MYFSSISILLLSTALNINTSNAMKPPQQWEHSTRTVNGLPDDRRNCFCYPEGELPTVHGMLDSQNNGQERVVIYLYKTVGSNEIIMYIPNPDKQVLIPDIPYESGDGLLEVTTENIFTLFYNSPYKIKVFNNHFETVNPAVTDSSPIGLNQGSIELVYSKDTNQYPETLIPKPWTPEVVNVDVAVDSDRPENNEQYEWISNVQHPYKNPGIDNVVFTYDSGSSAVKNYQSSDTLVTFTMWFNYQMQRFQHVNLYNDIKAIDSNILRILVQKVLSDNYIYVSSDGIISDSKGIVIDPSNLELRPVFLGEKFQQNSQSSITIPKHLPYLEGILVAFVTPALVLGIIPLGKTYLGEKTYLGASLDGSTIANDTEILYNSHGNANLASYTSAASGPYGFSVKETYTAPISPYFGGNGNQISVNSYSNFDREPQTPSYSYTIPNENPYSEASKDSYWSNGPYVATQEPYPTSYWNTPFNGQPFGERRSLPAAKIVHLYKSPNNKKTENNKKNTNRRGIPGSKIVQIYNKKTDNKKTENNKKNTNRRGMSGTKIVQIYNKKTDNKKNTNRRGGVLKENDVSLEQFIVGTQKPYPTSYWNIPTNAQPFGERRGMPGKKIVQIYNMKTSNKKTENNKKNTNRRGDVLKENGVSLEEFIEGNISESGRRFPKPSLKGIMKTLMYLLNDIPSRRDNNSGANSTDEVSILNESESLKSEDGPDFRIIGGNAATGSGTPLSNKGRSGFQELI